MDKYPSFPSDSLIVQMEEDRPSIQPTHFPNAISRGGGEQHPALAVGESASTRWKCFTVPLRATPTVTTHGSHAHGLRRPEKAIDGSSVSRNLDVPERKRLQAQLRAARQEAQIPRAGIEDSKQKIENLRRDHCSSLTNVQPGENTETWYPTYTVIDISGEGVRPKSQTTSTDSEAGIFRNRDKESLATSDSKPSEESRGVETNLLISSTTTTGTFREEIEVIEFVNEAWETFESSWKSQIRITAKEKQNGYRFLDQIDETYLGFRPRRNDKRRFLKAYPIIGPVPEARLGCNCSMPMTCSQWGFVVGFFIIFIGLGVGGYFYLEK